MSTYWIGAEACNKLALSSRALYSNFSTGPLYIYEVKRSQIDLLAAIENNWLEAPTEKC